MNTRTGERQRKEWIRRFLLLITFALVVAGTIALRPRWVVTWLSQRHPTVVFRHLTQAKVIAVTIDDGPDSSTTEELLAVLKAYGAKATFFTIGNHIAGNERILSLIQEEGHEIGNHTWNEEPSYKLAPEKLQDSLTKTAAALAPYNPGPWFRPGSGRVTEEMCRVSNTHTYRCVLGSIYPYDVEIPSARFATWFILANAEPGGIIILHDRGARGQRTTQVLRSILPVLKDRGYEFVTISQLLRTP